MVSVFNKYADISTFLKESIALIDRLKWKAVTPGTGMMDSRIPGVGQEI